MDLALRYVYDCMSEEVADDPFKDGTKISVDELFMKFILWKNENGYQNRGYTKQLFGKHMSRLVENKSMRLNGAKVRGFEIERAIIKNKLKEYLNEPGLTF